MTRPSVRSSLIAIALATVLVVTLFGGVDAAISPTYGSVVSKNTGSTSTESKVFLTALAGGAANMAPTTFIRFWDGASATPTTTSEWYVDMDNSGTVTVNDVRILVTSFSAGTKVRSGDSDLSAGRTFGAAGNNYLICYSESQTPLRPAGTYSPATPTTPSTDREALYIHIGNACGAITTGDVRITGTPSYAGSLSAGTRVADGDSDRVNNVTTAFPGGARVQFYDADASAGYSFKDGVYIDIAANGRVDPGDIRVSTADGASFSFGTVAQVGDADIFWAFTALGAATLQSYDADGSGAGAPNCSSSTLQDTLILRMGGAVAANDLRVTARTQSPTFTEGTKIRTGNPEIGQATTAVTLRYHDANNNGRFDFGDHLYVDLGTANTVDAGDIRLSAGNTAGGFASCVVAGNSDLGLALTAIPAGAGWRFLDADNSGGYTLLDLIYFGNTAATFTILGDFRMQTIYTGTGAMGSRVGDNDIDSTTFLRSTTYLGHTPALSPTFKYIDLNGDATYTADEPVYLSMKNQATVQPGDVRITGFGGKSAGTQVGGADSDSGQPLVTTGTWSPQIMWVESGVNSSGFDDDDYIYIRLKAGTTLTVGDVRLRASTYGQPGSKVLSGNGDISSSLQTLPNGGYNVNRIQYLKAEHATPSSFTSFYTVGDHVYYDTDNNDNVTVGDVHLTGSGGVTTSNTGGGNTGGNNPPVTPTNNPTASFSFNVDHPARLVTFDATSSTAASGRSIPTTGYAWTFGDGSTGAGRQTTHTYAANGTYTVVLVVTDNQGSTAQTSASVLVGPAPTQSPTPSSTPDESPDASPDPTGSESPGDTPARGTPGPALLMVLVLMALAAVALRRRQ